MWYPVGKKGFTAMYTYRFNHQQNKHEVLDPNGYVIFRTRLKYAAKERVDMENNAVSMRKYHESRVK